MSTYSARRTVSFSVWTRKRTNGSTGHAAFCHLYCSPPRFHSFVARTRFKNIFEYSKPKHLTIESCLTSSTIHDFLAEFIFSRVALSLFFTFYQFLNIIKKTNIPPEISFFREERSKCCYIKWFFYGVVSLYFFGSNGKVKPMEIIALFSGKAVPFGPNDEPSAIVKTPLNGSVRLGTTGLEGDECGDQKNHGGPEKALHHYAFDHYDSWRNEGVDLPAFDRGGLFGENLSTVGMIEDDVCIGDIHRFGEALIEVSQARQPCWKLNVRFSVPDMARRVQDSCRTGWYYRVLEEGNVSADAPFVLVERRYPQWPLSRILKCFYKTPLEKALMSELAALEVLSPSWRAAMQKRLDSGQVESWQRRLTTPEMVRES